MGKGLPTFRRNRRFHFQGFQIFFLNYVSMKWQPKITFSYMEKGRVYLGLHWVEFYLHAPTVHRIPLHIP